MLLFCPFQPHAILPNWAYHSQIYDRRHIHSLQVSIEEPFSILALEAICETALSNVRELQTYHDTALASNPNGTGSPRQPLPAGRLVALTTKSGQQAGGLPRNSTLATPNVDARAGLEAVQAGNGHWAGEGVHGK